MEKVNAMVSENAVVIFSKSSCTMSHSVKALFADYGTNPKVYELDEMAEGGGGEIEEALSRMGCKPTVPTVFIHGELVGGAKEVISLHIQGSLVTKLQDVGALST